MSSNQPSFLGACDVRTGTGLMSQIVRYRVLLFSCVTAIAMGIFLRVYQLGYPNEAVFDEVYFPVSANAYLHGLRVFDVHPPLAKLLMACGIAALGNDVLGW